MAQTDIGKATVTDLTNQIVDYSVDTATTDGASESKETEYTNEKWSQQLGYYKKIPELKIAIDTKAQWVVGNGFEADEATTMLLGTIRGFGKDTFTSILENMERTADIGGDSFAEIITDNNGILFNLKPLDPSVIKIITDRQGLIIRYEQISKVKQPNKRFEPNEIFHLMSNRIADEIHGTSIIDAVEEIILTRNEATADWKRVLHRNVEPVMIIHADTDDTTELAKIKTDWENVKKLGETWIVPKGVIVPEFAAIAPNATLSPLPWIESNNDYFYETVGVPKIVIGNSKNFTDASSKMVYLTWENRVKTRQKDREEQVLIQLNIEIELVKPALLENEVLAAKPTEEERGEEPIEQAAQPNDTTAELEGVR